MYMNHSRHLENIVAEFCKKGAIGLTTQHGQEYGFPEYEQPRATEIYKILMEQLDNLSVNNLDCEGDFLVFDCLVRQSAMCASQKFTGKGMRDEITLIQSDVAKIEKVTKTIETR